jgi:hypothetical protein
MPRATGVLMLGLGVLVFQLYRLNLRAVYAATIGVRAVFVTGFFGLYLYSRDPLFLFICGVIGIGMMLTSLACLTKTD